MGRRASAILLSIGLLVLGPGLAAAAAAPVAPKAAGCAPAQPSPTRINDLDGDGCADLVVADSSANDYLG